MDNQKKRAEWGSKLGFILAAAVAYNLFRSLPLFVDHLQRTGKIGKPRYSKR
jgi:hypothetical protein